MSSGSNTAQTMLNASCVPDAQATRRSMTLVGIPKAEQDAAFRTVAAVLHLGNLDFVDAGGDSESSALAAPAKRHLTAAAKLLGVDAAGLLKALTTRTRQTVDGARARP